MGEALMTELLDRAVRQAATLPPEEQDALAAVLLEELASERRWSELLAGGKDKLAAMAAEAREELRSGRTEPLDPDLL